MAGILATGLLALTTTPQQVAAAAGANVRRRYFTIFNNSTVSADALIGTSSSMTSTNSYMLPARGKLDFNVPAVGQAMPTMWAMTALAGTAPTVSFLYF